MGGVTPTHLKLSFIDWLLYLQQIALFDQKKRIYSENKLVFAPWYFLLPAIAFFFVYVIIPIFQSVWISFYEWDGLGEAEWLGFAIMTWSIAGLAFFLWTFFNLVPRALSHHKWYKEKFPDYPKSRKAVFPFIL